MKIVDIRHALFIACMAAGVAFPAASAFAENLLLNGQFEADQVDVPTYWRSSDPENLLGVLSCKAAGGPEGKPSVRFFNRPGGKAKTFTLRQYDLTLVKDGRYRIAAWVRTAGFRAKRFGILVINAKWHASVGIESVAPDSDWRRLEAEFDAPDSLGGRYSVAVFMQKFTGEIEVADISLEPLSAAAKAGSKPSIASTAMLAPRLYPWAPLLAKIPADTRAATFRFSGELPKGTDAADCKVSVAVDGVTGETAYPLSEFVKVSVPPGAPNAGKMRVRLLGKDGAAVADNVYPYRLVPCVEPPKAAGRRLNNFVTELLNAPVESDSASFRFAMAKDGWTFIRVEGGGKASASLDGKAAIDPSWEAAETFRNIAAGEHSLDVAGAKGGRIVVRAVVETLNYPPCCDSVVKENPSYGWEFFKKHVMRSCTTQNGGMIPKEHQAEFFAHGGEWLSNFVAAKHIKSSEELPQLILSSPRFTPDCYQGTTVDEFFLGSPDALERYGNGLKMFNAVDSGAKRVYTWLIGKPGCDGLSREFMSTVFNVSQGRGKALFEVYCRTKPTEAMARAYLKDYIGDTLEKCRQCLPDAEGSVGLILGNFNQLPVICAVHHPEVDYKYFLDMQLNYMATDPAFEGLGCTGYWGSYYGDYEMHRWSMALLRHYCVEGRTDMLSERYGFAYVPGHLKNGDFNGSFDSWHVEGDVSLDEASGLGACSQRRWGASAGVGDTFASFRRGTNAANRVSQRVKGLVPGRMYCLQAATFDAKDMKAGRVAPRKFALSVTVQDGAEVEPALSWVHVDGRTKLSAKNGGARINLHHVVFTARASEAMVVLSDADAKPGETLGVNAVSLNPYYKE